MEMLKRLLLVGILFSQGAFAEDGKEPGNFELYQQGQVVASIQKMNQELWTQQFPTRQLNRMLSRLNSAYETNLGISSDLYERTLDKIRKQQSADRLEMDPDILYTEFKRITRGPISVDQVENLINSAVNETPGDKKTLQLLVLKMVAHRIYIKTKDLKALFLAGRAGYHRFNTGTQHLEAFKSVCLKTSKNKICEKYLESAQKMLSRSQNMKLSN